MATKKKVVKKIRETKKVKKGEKPNSVTNSSKTLVITLVILFVLAIIFASLYFLQPAKFKKQQKEAVEQARTVLLQQVGNLEEEVNKLKGDLTEKDTLGFETVYTNEKYGFELTFSSTWGELSTSGDQVITGEPFLNQLESNEINIVSSKDPDRRLRLYVVDAELKDQIKLAFNEPVQLLKETDEYLIYYQNYGVLNKSKCSSRNYSEEDCDKYNPIDLSW